MAWPISPRDSGKTAQVDGGKPRLALFCRRPRDLGRACSAVARSRPSWRAPRVPPRVPRAKVISSQPGTGRRQAGWVAAAVRPPPRYPSSRWGGAGQVAQLPPAFVAPVKQPARLALIKPRRGAGPASNFSAWTPPRPAARRSAAAETTRRRRRRRRCPGRRAEFAEHSSPGGPVETTLPRGTSG